MDDAADGVYSRAPVLQDLLTLCAALNRTVQGVEIPVASKELLIRMKDTVRPSDAADVAFLRLRIEEGKHHGKQ